MVAREGLEPSKPLGRQIYSLLRLTASLPRQLSVNFGKRVFSDALPRCRWSWRRDLNPRPADYKSAALPTELRQPEQKANFSTSRATRASNRDRDLQMILTRFPQPTIVHGLSARPISLPNRLEERNPGRHRDIQALNVSPHGDGHEPVASFADEAAQPRSFSPHNQ